jgi:hypothetical protein
VNRYSDRVAKRHFHIAHHTRHHVCQFKRPGGKGAPARFNF